MQFMTCGLNHQTASLVFREKLSFLPHQITEPLQTLLTDTSIEQAALLSTCNRTEIYCYGYQAHREELTNWLATQKDLAYDELEPHIYFYQGGDALRHLLRVAVGLDSLVLGEPQILGQLKSAYRLAASAGTLKTELDHLFQFIFQSSKRIRHETSLGRYSLSVAAIAIDLLEENLNLNNKKVLLIGSGETIHLSARYLQDKPIADLLIANRTLEKAQQLATEFSATPLGMNELPHALSQVDAVITATSCPYPIIGVSTLSLLAQKPQIMIDLAVPRDIEDAVATLPDTCVFTIDDLSEIAKRHHQEREIAAMRAEQLINTELSQYVEHHRATAVEDLIRLYRQHAEAIRDIELVKATNALTKGQDSTQVLANFARTLTNKLLHIPSVNIRRTGHDHNIVILNALRDIFSGDH